METANKLSCIVSGFVVNATLLNESSIIVDCQHSSFNYSRSLLSIQQKEGNEYGTGSKNYHTPGCLSKIDY